MLNIESIMKTVVEETALALMSEESETVREAFRKLLTEQPRPSVQHMVGMTEAQIRAEVRQLLSEVS